MKKKVRIVLPVSTEIIVDIDEECIDQVYEMVRRVFDEENLGTAMMKTMEDGSAEIVRSDA